MVKARHERDKYLERADLAQTRLICWYIYRANADPKTAAKTIEEFMPLDGCKPKPKVLSQKQLQAQVAKLEARLNSNTYNG